MTPDTTEFAGRIFSSNFTGWETTIPPLLDAAKLPAATDGYETILIKPNLVEDYPPPITVPAPCVAALVKYLQARCPEKRIIIGEGTGSNQYNTFHCFTSLGYTILAKKLQVELVDLNLEPSRHHISQNCTRWPEMYLPELLDNVFLLSVPVLKAHSLAGVTLTMKNMMGCPPPEHYQQGGAWKKAAFHHKIHEAIFDLNRYRTPDFTLLEATIGMAEAHLWGARCTPPVNILAASHDPVAIDAYGCALLGRSWHDIDHIRLANTILGQADNLTISHI